LPRRLARLAGSAAVLATLLVHALLQAVPAIAAAPPTQTPCAGAPAVDDPAPSFVDAFAQPLADGAVLALTARIVRAPQDARAALLESVKHPPSAAVRAAVDRAVRAKCAAPLISQAAVRAANELAVVWSDLPSDRVDAYIAQRLIFALAAEAVRDALPAETLAAALDGAVPPAEGPPLAPPIRFPRSCMPCNRSIRRIPPPCARAAPCESRCNSTRRVSFARRNSMAPRSRPATAITTRYANRPSCRQHRRRMARRRQVVRSRPGPISFGLISKSVDGYAR